FVSYYSCVYNWPENDILDERTNEYFFEDIASVRNDTELMDYTLLGEENNENEKKTAINAKVFKLTNMSGDSLTLITEIPLLNVPDSYVNNLEKLVRAMRVLLRNRRYGETIQEEEKATEMKPADQEKADKMNKNDKSVGYFHQQLREIYDEYSADLEKEKAELRNDDRENEN
ncbi:MAG: hypothetical protein U9N85_05845, partial [Bacteroidota bacterium]|nr:hypothetical protein [Bacteroidota bacterium]